MTVGEKIKRARKSYNMTQAQLAENIMKLYAMSAEERKQLGDNAFNYHMQYHERNKVLGQLMDFIFN